MSFDWFTPDSATFMARDGSYLLPGQTVRERARDVCDAAEKRLNFPGFADKFYDYFSRGWYSFATPVWTNFGTDRGLPVSCFNSYMSDSVDSILGSAHAEVAMMTKNGGGTSIYMGDVRGRGSLIQGGRNGHSFGSVHFAGHYQSLIQTCSQGSTRRGNLAVYWPIDHPDIREVLRIRQEGSPLQHVHVGLTVTDRWLEEMVAGDRAKREVWAELIRARQNVGEPYVLFLDTVNRNLPPWYGEKGLRVRSSNLCIECVPTSDEEESFVCVLSSLNARYYDQWKGTDAPAMMAYFLDAVNGEFIDKARQIPYMHRAVRYAERHRSLGVGLFGWHHLLMSRKLPFASPGAMRLNAELWRTIRDGTEAASRRMAVDYGEPEVTKGHGVRHALLRAVAPTTSSAFIIGQSSEGVDPLTGNVEVKDLAKGKFTVTNPYLLECLEAHGKNDRAVLDSVIAAGGSVRHLDFLSESEKEIFLTFPEISQEAIVNQAAQRQAYIDQGQSLNTFLTPDVSAKETNALMLHAWRSGVKSLYYNKGVNAAQQFTRQVMGCGACEG